MSNLGYGSAGSGPGFRVRDPETHGIIRCLLGRQAASRPPHNREPRMLSTFIAAAAAPAAAAEPNPIYSFGFIILLFVVFYFLLIRPQQKRAKEQKKMIAELTRGDEVIAAGILGRIETVGEHFLTVEIADKVQIRVQKGAVSTVLPKGTLKSA
jgi:preprotein translocase subunit YajC